MTATLGNLHNDIVTALEAGGGVDGSSGLNPDAVKFAHAMLPGLVDVAINNPTLGLQAKGKDLSVNLLADPAAIGSKSWFSDVVDTIGDVASTVGSVASTVAQIAGKDYRPSLPTMADIAKTIPSYRLQDKDWVNYVANAITTIAPAVLNALQGSKAFAAQPQTISLTAPAGKDKSWFSDALSVVAQAAPYVISAIA